MNKKVVLCSVLSRSSKRSIFSLNAPINKIIPNNQSSTLLITNPNRFYHQYVPLFNKSNSKKPKISTIINQDELNEELKHKPVHPNASQSVFEQKYYKCLELNALGKIDEFVEAYEELKMYYITDFTVDHYNQLLLSLAPRQLMFEAFKPYKDYVDMYFEVSKYRPKERMDESRIIYNDLVNSPLGLKPNIITYNTMMKVQLSGGARYAMQVFDTFNYIQSKTTLEPNMTTYTSLLRACAMLERDDVAEEIYVYVLQRYSKSFKERMNADGTASIDYYNKKNAKLIEKGMIKPLKKPDLVSQLNIHFYNTMLDVYAESRNPFGHQFFYQMLEKRLPVNGNTFNTYAKLCIFLDEREKLVDLGELMRVEGVLYKELSGPVQEEIYESFKNYTEPHYIHSKRGKFMGLDKAPSTIHQVRHAAPDLMDDLRLFPSWGRLVDLRDYRFLEVVQPYIDKYSFNSEKIFQLLDTAKTNEIHKVASQDRPF